MWVYRIITSQGLLDQTIDIKEFAVEEKHDFIPQLAVELYGVMRLYPEARHTIGVSWAEHYP